MLALSLDELGDELKTRCAMLAVFPEDTEVPLVVVGQLWGTDEVETEEAVTELAAWNLVEVDWEWRKVYRGEEAKRLPPSLSLIDLHLDYLRASAKDDLAGWHRALLQRVRAAGARAPEENVGST